MQQLELDPQGVEAHTQDRGADSAGPSPRPRTRQGSRAVCRPALAGRARASRPALGLPVAERIAFAEEAEQARRAIDLATRGLVVVTAAPPAAYVRAALAEHLDDLIERELASRGAPSPHLASWSTMPDDAEARLSDQLFRARTVGAPGLAIVVGSLRGISMPSLAPEDCAALDFLAAATQTAPLVLVLDATDADREAYIPVELSTLLGARATGAPAAGARAGATPAGGVQDDARALDEARALETETALDERDFDEVIEARTELDADEAEEILGEVLEEEPAETRADDDHADETAASMADDPVAEAPAEAVHVEAEAAAPGDDAEPIDTDLAETPTVELAVELESRPRARAATVGVPVAGPSDEWRSWALALGAARGPQPLGAFERLFTESYMPLANAIACGLDDARATRAHDDFRRSFERSYTDAFLTFGATGRRPRLVMDAYDVAAKQARLHSARTTHLMVVDGMRWDLGCLVRDAITRKSGGNASLTAETLLWSALPTTTFRQLETLARGMDALRAPAPEEGAESLRGLRAETVRRLRVGSRELYKLDVIPSMLGSLDGAAPSAGELVTSLAGIADVVAEGLVRHVATLPPRTLLLVIGDHGFAVDRRGRISHGGASPEEVLVPAFAYLVGDLH